MFLTRSREGAVTVLVGASTFFILPRDPATAKFLNAGERESVLHALARDREFQEEKEDFSWSTCLSALKAPQMWFVFIQFFSSGGRSSHLASVLCKLSADFTVMLYSLAFFTPSESAPVSASCHLAYLPAIVQAIGYRGTSIQLHSVPPYVCSTFTALVACYFGDRLRHRGAFVVGAGCVSIVGYAMYLSSTDPQVLYASLFLQIIGVYTVAPLQSTWMRKSLMGGTQK